MKYFGKVLKKKIKFSKVCSYNFSFARVFDTTGLAFPLFLSSGFSLTNYMILTPGHNTCLSFLVPVFSYE